jgi:putative transposase
VTVKFDPQEYDEAGDLAYVLVYDEQGNFLCRADKVRGVHPAARILGDERHQQELKAALQLRKGQEAGAANVARTMLENVVIPETQARLRVVKSVEDKPETQPHRSTVLPKTTISKLEAAKDLARQQMAERATYMPPEKAHNILTEYDRYKYLLELSERDGVELTEADRAWMRGYENTDEYRQTTSKRFNTLRELYARKRERVAAN